MGTIFRFSNLLVLPFWALMMLAPGWRWTKRIMRSPLISAAPAAIYVALVLPRLGQIWPAVARPTLAGVMTLLGSSTGATIAWIHFLAFDLLVGRWIYLDAQERQISTWLMVPSLFLTLMLGPSGFLLYLAVRSFTNLARRETAGRALTEAAQNREESFLGIAELSQRAASTARGFLRGALDTSWPLTFLGFAMVLTLLATIVGVFVDHRVITGAPVWLKPAKFAISVSIYCFTFVWLLSLVENRPRLVRLAANVTVISFIVEMVVIITQAARGTTSHFNISTPLNSFLWLTMGTFIAFVWGMNLLVTVLLVRQRIPDRAFAWSMRLGLFISLVGMAAAGLMVRATPTQMAAISAGQRPHIIGAHSVGVADGGPGLPIVGWSTVGGLASRAFCRLARPATTSSLWVAPGPTHIGHPIEGEAPALPGLDHRRGVSGCSPAARVASSARSVCHSSRQSDDQRGSHHADTHRDFHREHAGIRVARGPKSTGLRLATGSRGKTAHAG